MYAHYRAVGMDVQGSIDGTHWVTVLHGKRGPAMTVTAKIVTPPPKPADDPRRVVLDMPYDVAVTLRCLLGCVAGDPIGTYRLHTGDVADALDREMEMWPLGRFEGIISASYFGTSTE